MNKIKAITHVLAVGVVAVIGYAATPWGKAFLMANPVASAVLAAVTAVAAATGIYKQP